MAVADALAAERIDAIYSSDLTRAVDTARAIAAPHRLDVASDARLREFAFGRWEGLTWNEIVAAFPASAQGGFLEAREYRPPGGETFDLVKTRVGGFLDELVGTDQQVAIVAHAGVMHAALAHLFGDGYFAWSVRLMPASITRVDVDASGSAALISHNQLVNDEAGA